MKNLIKPTLLAAVAALCVWAPVQTMAQPGGGGGFNREEMRQRMMDRYKEMLEITDDAAWNAIRPRVEKVTDARREVGFGGMRGGAFAFGGQQRRGGGGGDQADRPQRQGQGQRRGGFGPEQSQAQQELQRAIESKASADTIKSKLAAVRAERKAKQDALDKAQEDLRKVLTVRQEALAVVAGLLD